MLDKISSVYNLQSYPDDDGEQGPAAGGQADVGVQQELVQVGVWEQRQLGQHGGHLQVNVVGLQEKRMRHM